MSVISRKIGKCLLGLGLIAKYLDVYSCFQLYPDLGERPPNTAKY